MTDVSDQAATEPVMAPSIEFTPPCLGSVGSKPFLDDVERQLTENRRAQAEGTTPKILPVKCRLCNSHHESNQLDASTVFTGTEFEEYAYNRIAPRPNGATYAPDDLLVSAHMAVNGGVHPFAEVIDGDSTAGE
jgi:hypothetical protein